MSPVKFQLLSLLFYLLQIEQEPKPTRSNLPKEKRDTSRDRARDRSRGRPQSAESEDLLFSFLEDDEMDRINRKALLGKVFSSIN